jgi:periplasmic divalent cation tolerance protein
MATDALLVLTTLGSTGDARALVRSLVEDRLIACGTMVPAASIYRWEGAVHEEEEVVVLLKTDASKWDALAAAVQDRHPYDLPELLAFPAQEGSSAYLNWLKSEVAR